jgi:hypothetical protein
MNERLSDATQSTYEQVGVTSRAQFRQAYADVINEIGGDRTVEFLQTLQLDIDADAWPSPALLGELEQHSKGAAERVFDRWQEIQDEHDEALNAQPKQKLSGANKSPKTSLIRHLASTSAKSLKQPSGALILFIFNLS